MNGNYYCEKCEYITKNKQSYNRHLISKKHNETNKETYIFVCLNCNKKYKYQSGLCNHKKYCNSKLSDKKTISIKELENKLNQTIEQTINKNYESLKALFVESNKTQLIESTEDKIKPINQYITNNTTNNFNINIFLKDCKDALNMLDFIESLRKTITISNIQNVSNHGYVNGYTINIIDKLKNMPLYHRPIHYHEPEKTIYIKYENEWKSDEKEVKEIINETIFTMDRITTCKISGLKNITELNFDKEMKEIEIHGGLMRENKIEQNEILNNIIPHITVP